MTTRSTSDKEEINDLYQTAIGTPGIPGRSKNTKIVTSTPVVPSESTRKTINFVLNDSENPSGYNDETLVPGSDDSEDDTVEVKENVPPPKLKRPVKMTNPNPYAPLKYAVEAVPFFDGQNMPLSYFIEGCEEAKAMLPAETEPQFTRIIRTRIVGEARRTIQDLDFNTVAQLTACLKKVYGASKTVYQLQGELGSIYQKNEEDVVTYANRVKELGKQILEAYKAQGNNPVDPTVKTSLENDMSKCFIRGLKPEIEQRIARNLNVQETVADALRIERELRSMTDLRQGSASNQTQNIAQSPETCQICYKVGHLASKCRKLTQISNDSGLGTEILICQICKKRGHGADKCRYRDPQARQSVKVIRENNVICQLCSKSGHDAKSCRTNKNNTQSKPSQICQWCDKSGHTANNCWKKQNEQRDEGNKSKTICQICNNFGHVAKDCRSGLKMNAAVTDSVICRYCKEQGHLLENCELRIANNNRRKAYNSGNANGPSTSGVQQGSSKPPHPSTAQETK